MQALLKYGLTTTDLLVDCEWHGYGQWREPDGSNDKQTDAGLHARTKRMNDDAIAVDGDRYRRECRHMDTDSERHGNDVAHHVAERPTLPPKW